MMRLRNLGVFTTIVGLAILSGTLSDSAFAAKPPRPSSQSTAASGGKAAEAADVAQAGIDLGLQINQLIVQNQNRGGFVKQASEVAYGLYKQKYNVMVFNTSQNYDASGLQGVKKRLPANYQGVPYVVFIFKSGTFVNQGDGGFINWAFQGNWKRSGNQNKTVTFTDPAPHK
jgi:hypothetical protein